MTFDISQCEIGDIVTLINGSTVVYAGFDTASPPQKPRLPVDHPMAEKFLDAVRLLESFLPDCPKHWVIHSCLASQGLEEDFIVGFADTKDKPGNQEPWKELFYIQRVLQSQPILKFSYVPYGIYSHHPWNINAPRLAERFPAYFDPGEVHYFKYGRQEGR